MSELPWVRFFASDWLGGTRGMSAAETGIYITLVASMYERGEPIPEDHARLARLCGASNSTFKAALETLVSEGKIIRLEAGLWNGRVQKEVVYRAEKSEVGKQAANARWEKNKQNQGADDAPALPTESGRNANQKPEATVEDEAPKGAPPQSEIDQALDAYSQMAAASGLAEPRIINDTRRKKLAVILRDHGMAVWLEAVDRVGNSQFCRGQNDKAWRADLDFMLQAKSFAGILEGRYDNRTPPPRAASPPSRPMTKGELFLNDYKAHHDEPPSNTAGRLETGDGSGQAGRVGKLIQSSLTSGW